MFKLRYLGEVILEADTLDKIIDYKDDLLEKDLKFRTDCLKKVNKLNKERKIIEERNFTNSEEEYLKSISNKNFIEKFENLGKEYFGETLEGFYYMDIPSGLLGFKLKSDKKVSLTDLGFLISKDAIKPGNFEID